MHYRATLRLEQQFPASREQLPRLHAERKRRALWQRQAFVAQPLDDTFRGWGRAVADFETGLWWFETIKPGRVPGRHGHKAMAPHLNLWIVARGINIGLNTRMYFGDEAEANAEDPVLRLVEHPERRRTLIAAREERGGEVVYRFDIHLQGDNETVFFDV